MKNTLSAGQKVSWCIKVIHNASIRAKTRKKRWLKDVLTLNSPNEGGGEILDFVKCPRLFDGFTNVELIQSLQRLPKTQTRVLELLFCYGYSQQEVAKQLRTSQQQVSRLKLKGLQTLRTVMDV